MTRFLGMLTATTALVSAFAMSAPMPPKSMCSTGKGYGTDEPWAIEAFEKKTGHKVVNDYLQLRTGDADQAPHQSRHL